MLKFIELLDQKLVDDWRDVIANAWSMRIAYFWCFISALLLVVTLAFDDLKSMFGVWQTTLATFIIALSFGIARLLKQPGADTDG